MLSISPYVPGKSSAPGVAKIFKLHRDPVFAEFATDPKVLDLLVDLIGPRLDCFLSQFIFKNPGAIGQPWHQDSFYFPFEPDRQVGIWIAVTAATADNGRQLPARHAPRRLAALLTGPTS